MIHFVVSSRRPPRDFLETRGRELAPLVRVLTYGELFEQTSVPASTWVFTDHERLTHWDLERAAGIWQQLESSGEPMRLLNHPLRVMRRYELLRTLRVRGLNDFDVFRVSEVRTPGRFPVFVRDENEHTGPHTGLLRDEGELARAIESLEAAGRSRERLLVCEFRAEPDARGFYRKYGAFHVGGRIVPNHVLFSRDWKVRRREPTDADCTAEERRYVEANDHEEALREIFALARIDYGRVDFGLVNGRLQVFEINTNPTIMGRSESGDPEAQKRKDHFARSMVEALRALDLPAEAGSGAPARVLLTKPRVRRRRVGLRGWYRRLLRKVRDRARVRRS